MARNDERHAVASIEEAMIILNPMSAGQMTPAAQLAIRIAQGTRRAPARRRKARAVARKRAPLRAAPRKRARSASRPARLVKGSAAAKRYMASIRRRRRR